MEEKVLKIKLLREGAALPCRETAGSAGFDLRACLEIPLLVEPGEWAMVPTGLGAEIPQGMAGMVFSRSGLGLPSAGIKGMCHHCPANQAFSNGAGKETL